MRAMRWLTLLAGLLAAGPAAAQGCGTAAGSCAVAAGRYVLVLPPETAPRPVPALLWLHGWGSAPEATLAKADWLDTLAARGVALILPAGLPRTGRTQADWAVRHGGTHPRDDTAFLRAVLADAATHGIDRGRVLLAGFSRGGSFVWDVACHAPELARAYAPVGGAFWEPLPAACAGAVDLFHSHGWTDRVVPLEGRPIGGGRIMQGDLFASLAILRATLGCAARQPEEAPAGDGLWVRRWTSCAAGRIELELHPGGHVPPPGWLDRALDWFEARAPAPVRPGCAAGC